MDGHISSRNPYTLCYTPGPLFMIFSYWSLDVVGCWLLVVGCWLLVSQLTIILAISVDTFYSNKIQHQFYINRPTFFSKTMKNDQIMKTKLDYKRKKGERPYDLQPFQLKKQVIKMYGYTG